MIFYASVPVNKVKRTRRLSLMDTDEYPMNTGLIKGSHGGIDKRHGSHGDG